jgi:hypothetical protein
MTGKFHTTWGEFGGYKHPNALRYEASLSIANGARCSIGDQLHPDGRMDEATYRLIGEAYREVAGKEAWCVDVTNVADVALLSLEAAEVHPLASREPESDSDAGAVRMLLEGKILFDVIDREQNFAPYKVVILPDYVVVDEDLQGKLEKYLEQGGKVLATGWSGLAPDGSRFAIDLGVRYAGLSPYRPDYFRPLFEPDSLGEASYIFYSQGQKVELDGGVELGRREDPYFNRDAAAFCSHQHTPSSYAYGGPGMVESVNGIYVAWNVFEDYAAKGSLILKEAVIHALNRLLPAKTLTTSLPAQGVVTLQHQQTEKRLVHHVLYASPVRRGKDIEIIEDILPLYGIESTIDTAHPVKRVYLAPQMTELPFRQEAGRVAYTVPRVECHQMVVLDYE